MASAAGLFLLVCIAFFAMQLVSVTRFLNSLRFAIASRSYKKTSPVVKNCSFKSNFFPPAHYVS